MGIGNGAPPWRRYQPPSPHYPSWGSENYLGQRRQQRHRHLITPHGDRKLLPRRAVPVGAGLLITPHGDRKPCRPIGPAASTTSLPLMGIETSGRHAGRLITPHGDTLPASPATSSLPLMGIENVCVERRGRTLVLITPHGALTRARPAHYPSWGSKTGGAHGGRLPMPP